MWLDKIIYFAVLLNIVGHFIYAKSIIRGSTKPNLVSWFFWALAPFLGVFFQLQAGAGLSVLPILIAGLGSLAILLVALFTKNGFWKITNFDIYCGVFSALALILYVFKHNLSVAIFFAILSDAFAGMPTVIKSWKFPETENWAPYLLPIFSNTVGLLIIKEWSFTTYSFGMYFIILDSIIIYSIYHKKITSIFLQTFGRA